MAAYKFNLQKVLDLKENIEKEKKNEFGFAIKRLENEKAILVQLEGEMRDCCNEFEESTARGIQVDQLRIILDSIEYYKKSIKNQKVKIKMAEGYIEICRQELIKATKEKKMMEKLKEIDYKKFQYSEQKKEEKLVDDLVSFKESNNS